jgi:hypothetical protein
VAESQQDRTLPEEAHHHVRVLGQLLLEDLDRHRFARLSGHRPRYWGSLVNLVNFLLPAHIAGLACALLLYGNARLLPTV